MKIYKNIITVVIIAMLLVNVVNAKIRTVKTRRDFERTLSQDNMVVALFYAEQKNASRMRSPGKSLLHMYEDVSAYQPYDDADIIFLKINTGRPELAELAALYDVTNMPSFIFFNNGQRLSDSEGPIVLKGSITRPDLQSFIDQRYGAEIKKRIDEKNKRTQELVKGENETWKQYFYPRDIFVRGYAPAERAHNME